MEKPILVTGGGGFLGAAVCRDLVQRGFKVRSLARGTYSELSTLGVEQMANSITSNDAVKQAVSGTGGVIHCAVRVGISGKEEEYIATNVQGTHYIVQACIAQNIPLVYCSTPSVVIDDHSIEGGDESLPYAKNFYAHYPRTKAIAEREVLGEARHGKLHAVALRPHYLWGPGDPHFLPRILERRRKGKLRKVGNLDNQVDVTFIENAAFYHVEALLRLQANPKAINGNVYFLGQETPVNLWQFIDRLLATQGLPPVPGRVPFRMAYAIGATLEYVHRRLHLNGEPQMTRMLARQLSTSHYFSHAKATRDFGPPPISIEQGLERLAGAKHGH